MDDVFEQSLADWPAAVVEEVHGWRLQATPGVRRRRSTAAVPPTAGACDRLDEVLAAAAAFAAEHGQPLVVQVGPLERHAALDAELARRGWAADAPTAVLAAPATALAAAADVEVGPLTPEWLAVHEAVEGRPDTAATVREVHGRVGTRASYVVVREDGVAAAVGLAVTSERFVGVFSVATLPAFRGRGLATALLGEVARRAGERTVYLQVGEDNPARGLYERLGMRRSHSYLYRLPR